jgi:hypothetical protein
MKEQTVQRIVWTASYIGLAVDVATLVMVGLVWSGHSFTGAFVTSTATALMIATLALQGIFIVMQLFPNGQAMVPGRLLGPDGWSFVIASTAIPGVLWHNLAALAIPAMRLIMPGFTTPLLTCLLLLVVRRLQQRSFGAIRP